MQFSTQFGCTVHLDYVVDLKKLNVQQLKKPSSPTFRQMQKKFSH